MKNNYRGYVGTYIQQLSMQVSLLMLTSHFQGFLSLPNFIVRSHFKQINCNLPPGTCTIIGFLTFHETDQFLLLPHVSSLPWKLVLPSGEELVIPACIVI